MNWYIRHGAMNPCDPLSYSLIGATSPFCSGAVKICSIRAHDDGWGRPIINTPLLQEMLIAQNNNSNTVNVHLRS